MFSKSFSGFMLVIDRIDKSRIDVVFCHIFSKIFYEHKTVSILFV